VERVRGLLAYVPPISPPAHPRQPWFRLDMLLDGIFAIAATLLVLDLHLPTDVPPGQVGHELTLLWPQYLAYGLGFVQILAGWVAVRRVSACTTGVDHYGSLGMLLALGMFVLTPFTTAVLARSIRNHADLGSAVRLMSIVLLVTMLIYSPTVYYLIRRGFLREDISEKLWTTFRILTYTAWIWPLAALLLSYLSPAAALALIAAYFLLNLWPNDPTPTGTSGNSE
jgi:uncharacterized membrane protein